MTPSPRVADGPISDRPRLALPGGARVGGFCALNVTHRAGSLDRTLADCRAHPGILSRQGGLGWSLGQTGGRPGAS